MDFVREIYETNEKKEFSKVSLFLFEFFVYFADKKLFSGSFRHLNAMRGRIV